MEEIIKKLIQENIDTSSLLLKTQLRNIEHACTIIRDALKKGNKLFIFGNGGSAADSQHIAAEFINKFKLDREPLPAIALTTDSSILTAISNDSGYKHVFEKQIKALSKRGDVALAITTSDSTLDGHSSNIALALQASHDRGVITIGFVSEKSKHILKMLDAHVAIPSSSTPRIQESHILVGHIICEIVEKELMSC